MANISCPRCGMQDQVQKVSSVYSSGVSDTTVSGPVSDTARVDGKVGSTSGYGTLSGSSITIKAQELSPPPKPTKEKGYGCFGWGFFFGISGVFSLIAVWGDLRYEPYHYFISFLILPGIPILFTFNHFRKVARGEARHKKEIPIWENAMRKWDLLYYCHRDDVIYIPGTDFASPTYSMNDLIYS